MIKILERIAGAIMHRNPHLALDNCMNQQWRARLLPIPKWTKVSMEETELVRTEQVKYALTCTFGRELYCNPKDVHRLGEHLFEAVREELLGEVLTMFHNLRAMGYSYEPDEMQDYISECLKQLGEDHV